jgi:AcrR family transcriptional regulator
MKENLKIAAGKKTIKKIIAISKMIFAEHGYDNTTLEEVAKMGNLTRGALYHHFGNKKGLFQAVLEDVLHDYSVKLEKKIEVCQDPWEKLLKITYDFLEACTDPVVSQIIIIDGPSVLGPKKVYEIDEKYTMHIVKNIVSEMKDRSNNIAIDINAFSSILFGATTQSGIFIVHAEDPQKAFWKAYSTMEMLFSHLKNDME